MDPENSLHNQPEPAQNLQARVSTLLTHWGIPNATLAVAQGERLVYAGPIQPDSPSIPTDIVPPNVRGRIASLSKSITAAAILKLVDDDDVDLNLEDSAFQILSGFVPPWPEDFDFRLPRITVRHLLRHRAGWGDAGMLQGREVFFEPDVVDIEGANPETIIQWVRENLALTYDPGSHYYYSNIGYSLLGRIIERKSDSSYEDYVQENVLRPAGINNMELGISPPDPNNEDEFEYHFEGRLWVQHYDAAGGWIASAPDLLRFLFDIQYDRGHLNRLYENEQGCANSPCYRAGWCVDDNGMRWHTGKLPGTLSYMEWQPDDMSWAFIANKKPDLANQFLAELKNVINTEIRADEFSARVAGIDLFDCDPRVGQPVIGDGDPNVPCW